MYQTIISATTLATQLKDTNYVIFDCRYDIAKPEYGHQAYIEGHIPGAQYISLDKDMSSPVTESSGRHPLPNSLKLCQRLSQAGLTKDSQVIVYDQASGAIAGRMWWLMRWLGHFNVAVLDGGWKQWQALNLEVTTDIKTPSPSNFSALPDDSMWVTSEYVESLYNDPTASIIDARDPKRFSGENETVDSAGGHIPNSVNYPFAENLDAQGCFLSGRQLYGRFLPDQKDQTIHSCGSGVTACHNILAMEIAGLKGSKLYVGSWSEWIRSPQRPIEKGD